MNTSVAHTDPSDSSRSIWVFTPSRTDPADLEAILVQRHDLLKDAVERVRESALTANKHHLLFVGPRGCGKTHLVTLIVSRIRADAEASQHLRLAWLNEDETCTSLLELLIKVHAALGKRYPDEFRDEDLSKAYDLKAAAALDFVAKQLLAGLGSKTLVIVTENLDALFESMGEQGQKQLRAFIQEHPQFSIVATAQRLVEDLADRTSPFFGFFQTEHLKPLTVEQATKLLQNIARVQGRTEVTEFLDTSRGRSRVRALHHLSGGNHRIYIVLSQFITRETLDALIGPFLKMVDELTPYYQERLRWLPPLQRKIVELLCTCETTVPVKEIARRLFSTPQTISSQLQDLREKGYVESSQRGRESLYEISEPLMRICVEVKENQNTQPLRLLVDFLRVWYDDVELKRRLGLCQPESLSYGYLFAALERNDKEGNLRVKMLAEEVLGPDYFKFDANNLKKFQISVPEELLIAIQCKKVGDNEGAFECLEQALSSAASAATKAATLITRGLLYCDQGDNEAEITDYTRVIEMAGAPSNLVAMALVSRGVAYGRQDNVAGAIADFTRAIEMPSAPVDQVAMALFNRGFGHGQQGNIAAAIADYTRVIEMSGAPPDQVAMALGNRGVMHEQQGNITAAIADYTRVVEMTSASPDQVAMVLVNRGVMYGQQGDSTAAIADFTRAIDLPGAPPDLVAKALVNRGFRHFQAGHKVASRGDLESLTNLSGASERIITDSHFSLAVLHFSEGRWLEGFDAIEACLSLGSKQSPPYFEAPVDVIEILFTAGLNLEGRSTHAGSLFARYATHSALAVLGEALVKHLGSIFAKGEPWPASDNLDQWLAAWEQAAGDSIEFKLPLRLMRIGIAFIKSGGKDPAILLSLTSTERALLRQALGLEPKDET